MSELVCEWLRLDRTVVTAHAEAYRGLAHALVERGPESLERARSRDHAVSAHYLAVAAGYVSAASPADSGEYYRDASTWARRHADEMRRENVDDPRHRGWQLRALLMDACQPRPSMQEGLSAIVATDRPRPTGENHILLLILMRHLASRPDESGWLREALENVTRETREQSMQPVGVLQIPLGFVTRLSRFLTASPGEVPDPRLLEWARDYGARLAERVGIAQANFLQWRILHTRLLPIEPEALLALEIWNEIAARRRSREGQELLSDMPPVLRAYAEAARIIVGAASR